MFSVIFITDVAPNTQIHPTTEDPTDHYNAFLSPTVRVRYVSDAFGVHYGPSPGQLHGFLDLGRLIPEQGFSPGFLSTAVALPPLPTVRPQSRLPWSPLRNTPPVHNTHYHY